MQIPMNTGNKHAFKYGDAKLHSGSLEYISSLFHSLSFSFQPLLCFLTVLVPLFDIHKMHYCAVQRSSPLRGGYTCRFLQRRERTADSSSLLNSRPVLWATTPPPPCLSEHLFAMQIALFFWHSRSSQASSLSKRQFGGRKKVFSPHFKIQPLKQFEPMLIGKMLCPGGFMTTGSERWVFQLGAFLWVWGGLCLAGMTDWVVIAGSRIGRTGWFQSWVLHKVIDCYMFLILGVCVSVLPSSVSRTAMVLWEKY